ncbi:MULTISPECIES: enhanced intracellular survival protein Eis [unclassified Bacillus (in: firmicutes)]|uniref:GNAT family N-acetyltransferase n=1 Tax=unclassified Bacillus (in: firmicutes) TaxID=185979 RepID=UPI0008E5E7E4|nr:MULTISPECIES: GNAT family N-acetyltransferase [unclassified Bacillus (in: firmicutes)]SFA77951.1 Predicted acetyltransferase [Bacillus sp. UNCCL13]SFQ67834.1 Predicted acetyltransferase [Bacillus sp. cl95]
MESIIRKLTLAEIDQYAEIVINAYPGVMESSTDFKTRFIQSLKDIHEKVATIEFYGLFRDGKLIGGMRLHYYQMNLSSKIIDVGGVGLVAVDLLHKKEKVAKELITYFIDHFRNRGTSLVMLYPFRPDFYKKMGFGFGTRMNQYKIEPNSFPNEENKEGLVYLTESDLPHIRECYQTYAKNTHGAIMKTEFELERMLKNPVARIVGYMNDSVLEGYLLFTFQKEREANFLLNNLEVKEFIYLNPTSLLKLSSFLHTQADQVNRVILNTQDQSLEFLLKDARNGTHNLIPSVYHETNTSGTGIMYRVADIEKFINELSDIQFGYGNCKIKFSIQDSLISDQRLEVWISVEEGFMKVIEKCECEIEMDIDVSDFSSLLMGAVDPKSLYNYGKLKLNNAVHISTLMQLFINQKKPLCNTLF